MAHDPRSDSVHDLLYLRPKRTGQEGAEPDLLALLQERGWRYSLATRGEEQHADRWAQHAVGVIEFDGKPDELEQLQASGMLDRADEWVALIPAGSLECDELRSFVGGCCFDYHTLPVDPSVLVPMLGHARGMAVLRRFRDLDPVLSIADEGADRDTTVIVGCSAVMKELQELVGRIARFDAPVLIAGETGTGKELTARAIHAASPRRQGPMVTVDCGVIPQDLIYAELFGNERGAFTGATERRLGQVERADGGTLFLDEIGELPLAQQVHLLRVLQEGRIRRLGSGEERAVDVRVVAASHVDLAQAVREGRFREDLYYRLNVVPLRVPPLRERVEDIEPLAQYYFDRFRKVPGSRVRKLSRDACAAMREYAWPGNVRELQNRLRRAVVMCEGPVIRPSDLGFSERSHLRPRSLMQARSDAERAAIREALTWAGGSRTLAAQALGVSRVTLYRMMERLGLGGTADSDKEDRILHFPSEEPEMAEYGPRSSERSSA